MTDTLVWDEAGARYFETGVSKGIFFPIDGSVGVPWNGLVSVSLDPTGGELEHYHYDGVKYGSRVLAEDFQATVQAISTPTQFDECEGIKRVQNGLRTHFNHRRKFHMVWRTEVGSGEGASIGYKWHIAYNCLVQPAGRVYNTITDSSGMDPRSFVITATPACGRDSYFTFDSRDSDLSALEAQLTIGLLPKCFELKALAGPPAEGGGVPPNDDDCAQIVETFESYTPGEVVDTTTLIGDFQEILFGLINNGLDVTELPAAGAYAANDSAASEVGTGDILVDDDDATYITSADGDLGYTVGLPPLVGYVEGCTFELHVRASISGGVSPDDPDTLDADMQVHISTDAAGDLRVGGFSDGADEGMGFALSAVDGTPVDYVVPLSMDAWVDTTIDDVVTALTVGAYLNVVGATNNNTDTTPEVRVYEMTVVMLNDTEPAKCLRANDPTTYCSVNLQILDGGSTVREAVHTSSVDFKIVPTSKDASGVDVQGIPIFASSFALGNWSGRIYTNADEKPAFGWFADSGDVVGTDLASVELSTEVWYTLSRRWGYETTEILLVDRESAFSLLHYTQATPSVPKTAVEFDGGLVGRTPSDPSSTVYYEVMIDNTKIQSHCHEEDPTVYPPITIDLPASGVNTIDSGSYVILGDALSVPDDTDGYVGTGTFDVASYGNGPGAPDGYYHGAAGFYPQAGVIPDGYVLSSADLVVRAYADATLTIADPATDAQGQVPLPNIEPFLSCDHTSAYYDICVSPLPEGAYDGELVMGSIYISGYPVVRFSWNCATQNLGQPAPDIHVSYVAARATYVHP